MIRFEDYSQLKETYDKGKFDIFYENENVKYEVSHLGSTIYCKNIEKQMGMGAIQNFDIQYFYGIEKPEPVKVEEEENNDNDYKKL